MHNRRLPQVTAHYHFDATRDEPFVFDGRVVGKTLPGFPAAEAATGEK